MAADKNMLPEELQKLLQKQGVRIQAFPQAQGLQEDEPGDDADDRRAKALQFDFKPSQIKDYLDRYVIQQDDAKKVLATAVCDHYHHIQSCQSPDDCRDYKKQNIILIGPTGVGKTYLVQNIARLIGVPFVKADATKFSETGYVGGDVEDLIRDLVQQADGDIGLAEYGIVYLDEIDKIGGASSLTGRDVSGHGVQRGLLKMMEETGVPLRSPSDIAGQMQTLMEFQAKGKFEKKTISTKHILFIVSGAFDGLPDIIKKRVGAKQIGFREDTGLLEKEHLLYEMARSVDFIEYGFEAEFIGRLPVIVHCNQLTAEDLFKILKYSEGSLLKQYKHDFLAYGIDAYFTDGGMQAIAGKAVKEQTGARGLITVCEKTFRNYKYVLPDHPVVREFVVGDEMVNQHQAKLEELLANPAIYRDRVVEFQVRRFEEKFQQEYEIQVRVTSEAVLLLRQQADQEGKNPLDHFVEIFAGFEHGFNLLQKTSGAEFLIDEKVAGNPSEGVDRWIRESYQKG